MLVLALGLAACTGGTSVTPPADTPAEQPAATDTATEPAVEEPADTAPEVDGDVIDLSIMWWGSDARHTATLEAMELYTYLNPHITFTPQYTSWDGFWSQMIVLAATGTMPDLLQMDAAFVNLYVSNNQLADLSAIDLAGIVDPAILENMRINGNLYGIPLGRNGDAILYNRTALDEAGIPHPTQGWGWDEFWSWVEAAAPLLPSGMYAMFDMTGSHDSFQQYQVSHGGTPIFVDGQLSFDRDLWFRLQERMARYRAEGIVPPIEESLEFEMHDPLRDAMATGVLLMEPRTVASGGVLTGIVPEGVEIGVVNWPIGPGGGGWAQSTIFWSARTDTPYLQEGMDFFRWFISDPAAGEILMTVRGLPINDAVFESIEHLLGPADIMGREIFNTSVNNSSRPFISFPAEFNELIAPNAIYSATMEAFMFDMISLEEAWDTITSEGDRLAAAAADAE